jgi:hypothetical protein
MRLDSELAGRSRYRGNGSPFFDMMLIFVPNKQEWEHDGRNNITWARSCGGCKPKITPGMMLLILGLKRGKTRGF